MKPFLKNIVSQFFFYFVVFGIFLGEAWAIEISSSLVQIESLQKMNNNIHLKKGVGFVIDKNRILTNLHTVKDSDKISIKGLGEKKYLSARIEFSGYDCDLAILKTSDEKFFYGKKKIETNFNSEISTGLVEIIGIEENLLKKYSGQVQGVRFESYGYFGIDFHKIIETGFEIKEGFSGSPAFIENQFVGVAFQTSKMKSRIIHRDVVAHFLKDIEDGVYDGFVELGFRFQIRASQNTKNYFRIPKNQTGVFITSTVKTSGFEKFLQPKDFLSEIDGVPVSDEGLLNSRAILEIFEKKYVGDLIKLRYFRNGKSIQKIHKLQKPYIFDFYRDREKVQIHCNGIELREMGRDTIDLYREDFASSLAYYYLYRIQDSLENFSDTKDFVFTNISTGFKRKERDEYENGIIESINSVVPENYHNIEKICKDKKNQFIQIKFIGINLPMVLKNPNFANP
ncbi:MAG: S1C family serine protease [Leptospiraceae bacterium]|nr:serine protease [Leptospiraceae bacterium]MCK6381028.1 S1C family serine protease [Leptospiraceae bacterium]NUM41432.1 serine protease [Leptospiraceae bacterium]